MLLERILLSLAVGNLILTRTKLAAICAIAGGASALVVVFSLLQPQLGMPGNNAFSNAPERPTDPLFVSLATDSINIHESVTTTADIFVLQHISCFKRTDEIVQLSASEWYPVVVYDEIELDLCDQKSALQYGIVAKLDISKAGPEYLEEIEPSYTEYRLLNGTVLAFGEKRFVNLD